MCRYYILLLLSKNSWTYKYKSLVVLKILYYSLGNIVIIKFKFLVLIYKVATPKSMNPFIAIFSAV